MEPSLRVADPAVDKETARTASRRWVRRMAHASVLALGLAIAAEAIASGVASLGPWALMPRATYPTTAFFIATWSIIVAGALGRGLRAGWVAGIVGIVGLLFSDATARETAGSTLALGASVLLASTWWAFDRRTARRETRLALALTGIAMAGVGVTALAFWFAAPGASEDGAAGLLRLAVKLLVAGPPAPRSSEFQVIMFALVGVVNGMLITAALYLAGTSHLADTLASPCVTQDRCRLLMRAWGTSITSYMTLWPGNDLAMCRDGEAYLAYRQVGRVAVVLGDPVGPPPSRKSLMREFDTRCREQGITPVFYTCSATTVSELPKGYRALPIGESAELDLRTLKFQGKAWQDVRTGINRAAREATSFKRLADQRDGGTIRRLEGVSDEWLASKHGGELGFTLGTARALNDEEAEAVYAEREDGRVLAVVTWLPVYGRQGYALDLMRKSPEAWPGIMEFLIGTSLLEFQGRGYAFASLSGCPLASHEPRRGAGERMMGVFATRFGRTYGFESLLKFKEKFSPSWSRFFLAYQSPWALPSVAIAIGVAHSTRIASEGGQEAERA